jgi:hypothetical protein
MMLQIFPPIHESCFARYFFYIFATSFIKLNCYNHLMVDGPLGQPYQVHEQKSLAALSLEISCPFRHCGLVETWGFIAFHLTLLENPSVAQDHNTGNFVIHIERTIGKIPHPHRSGRWIYVDDGIFCHMHVLLTVLPGKVMKLPYLTSINYVPNAVKPNLYNFLRPVLCPLILVNKNIQETLIAWPVKRRVLMELDKKKDFFLH